jgi:neutral trehalase
MGSRPASHLFAELVHVLHDESDALVANDSARLLDATHRKEHLLRLLAPQANALRAMRRSGSDELERFAREAAQLAALDSTHVVAGLSSSRASAIDSRMAAIRAAHTD